jgi:hypothetical protein
MADNTTPDFAKRAARVLERTDQARHEGEAFDHFDLYRDPDYVPAVDRVEVRHLSHAEALRRDQHKLTDEQAAGEIAGLMLGAGGGHVDFTKDDQ